MLVRKVRALAAVCCALLALTVGNAIAQNAPPPRIPAPDREPVTGLTFPAEIANARLATSIDYSKTMNRPDLGYAWNYQTNQQLFVTLYVYPPRTESIPDGPMDDAVLAQFQRALADIYEGAKLGRYDQLKPVDGPDKCTIGGLTFLCATLSAIQPNTKKPLHTALMVTGYRDRFLKLRLDWVDTPANSRTAVDGFMQSLISGIRR